MDRHSVKELYKLGGALVSQLEEPTSEVNTSDILHEIVKRVDDLNKENTARLEEGEMEDVDGYFKDIMNAFLNAKEQRLNSTEMSVDELMNLPRQNFDGELVSLAKTPTDSSLVLQIRA